MNKYFDIEVVNGAATKKKYVSPEIEVINLDEQPMLLSESPYGARFYDVDREIDD